MDLYTLKLESQRLARRAQVLVEKGNSEPNAWYYGSDKSRPRLALQRESGILLADGGGDGSAAYVETPPPKGTKLYAADWTSLAPIEAIFYFGNEAIGAWLLANKWERSWGYNRNFKDKALVEQYEAWWQSQHPFYTGSATAILGGWHFYWPDDDWHDLLADELIAWTLLGEPWMEVWSSQGELRVIPRRT